VGAHGVVCEVCRWAVVLVPGWPVVRGSCHLLWDVGGGVVVVVSLGGVVGGGCSV